MYFRFRGNNVQIVKSQPEPGTGKAKSVPVGSINRSTLAISDKLRENCSAPELAEIEAWVKRYQKVNAIKEKHAAVTLPEQMAAAMEWFEQADPEEARQVAEDVLATSVALRQVLHRRGLL
jgi:hypothetical protein